MARTDEQRKDRLPKTAAEIRRRFESRRSLLQQACKLYANSNLFRKRKGVDFISVLPLRVFYCPIQKCGSTTWKKILNQIRNQLRIKPEGLPLTMPRTNPSQQRDFRGLVFVRDPYSRLLSAYVDKLFSPNPMYWNRTGKYIVRNFRSSSPSWRSVHCGHDVTFPEFILYILHSQTTGRGRDPHFIPAHDHCGFCDYNYTYVGHLETLSEDLPFVLKDIGSPVEYGENFEEDTLRANLRGLFKTTKDFIEVCMSLEEALRRLWKRWHIRGIISRQELFPLTSQQMVGVSLEAMEQAALEAHRKSGKKSERKKQKKAALEEAFAEVPLHNRLHLKQLLFLDFELFGFDSTPSEVFPTGNKKTSTKYSYFSLTD